MASGPPIIETDLSPGDVLYLPRGFVHSARALGGTTIHLTIGLHVWTQYHLAEAYLDAVRAVLATDEAVRASLPLGESILIGRTPDATLDLHDQYMSSRHAVIARTPSGYVVEDLGSTNGTYVNDRRITAPTPITPADTLRIGRTLMVVEG